MIWKHWLGGLARCPLLICNFHTSGFSKLRDQSPDSSLLENSKRPQSYSQKQKSGRKMSALRVIIKQSYNLKKRDEVSEDHAVVSDYLQSHGLYSPWNSPDQNTGVGSVFLFQGIFPTQGLNPGIQHCRWILCQLSLVKGSPGYVYLPLLHFITIYILFSMVLSLKKQNKTLLILSKVFFF